MNEWSRSLYFIYWAYIWSNSNYSKKILLIIKHIRKLQNTGVHILPKAVIGELLDMIIN